MSIAAAGCTPRPTTIAAASISELATMNPDARSGVQQDCQTVRPFEASSPARPPSPLIYLDDACTDRAPSSEDVRTSPPSQLRTLLRNLLGHAIARRRVCAGD